MTRTQIENVERVVRWQLCMGCGACVHACPADAIQLLDFPDQGLRPILDLSRCQKCRRCVEVCPGIGAAHQPFSSETIPELREAWGPVLTIWEGYATDPEIRLRGSSGGVVTALSLFCLEKQEFSGVLHIRPNSEIPWQNAPAFSKSRQELLALTGSRYSPAAPCQKLDWIEQAESKCVLVGKPCDVTALRKSQLANPALSPKVGLAISLFCAGTPCTQGTKVLLEALGVEADEVAELTYRGSGWPGLTTVKLKASNGEQREMTYAESWGSILSKHGQFRCRLCPDGTGEFADISCGDAWHRQSGPSESGWSIVLARTETGKDILQKAVQEGYLKLSRVEPGTLPESQKPLLEKRRKVWGHLLGRRMVRAAVPRFEGFCLLASWHALPVNERLKSVSSTLVGTVRQKLFNLRKPSRKQEPPINSKSQWYKYQARLQR